MGIINFFIGIGLIMAFGGLFMYVKEIISVIVMRIRKKEYIPEFTLNPFTLFKNLFTIHPYGEYENETKTVHWMAELTPYLALISLIIMILPYTSFGSETIGSIIEKQNYTTYYQAILTSETNKDYTVTVELRKEDDFLWPEEIFFGNGNHFEIWDSDGLEYYKNNGKILFDVIYIGDSKGNNYYLKILDSKTNEKITESFH